MNYVNIIRQHAEFLENTTKGLGNALLNHAETLLQRVHLHDQELSRIMVNCHFAPLIPSIHPRAESDKRSMERSDGRCINSTPRGPIYVSPGLVYRY